MENNGFVVVGDTQETFTILTNMKEKQDIIKAKLSKTNKGKKWGKI